MKGMHVTILFFVVHTLWSPCDLTANITENTQKNTFVGTTIHMELEDQEKEVRFLQDLTLISYFQVLRLLPGH